MEQLKALEVGERYDLDGFHVYRVEGKLYSHVYAIRYYEPEKGDKTFGHLKFNATEQVNEDTKVWLWVENWVFYQYMDLHYLSYIADEMGLRFHNITTLDLCIDLSFNTPRKLRRLLKSKTITTILNGKRVKDRDIDRPEITYTTSGSLNKTDRYLTVNIKQRNAMKDKSKGVTMLAYDKIAEIANSSGKEYIREAHGCPEQLYRLEIHMNNAELKEYWARYGREVDESLIYHQELLTIMFIEVLNSIVRFDAPEGRVDWETLLSGVITTTPHNEYIRTARSSIC
ncbi:hypothetical protein LJC45_04355 [Alistipes sp. OttesenSCG-928-B03]|nr:hypothetical protein [Alistipes sp. OttesenSCG-928-B03]